MNSRSNVLPHHMGEMRQQVLERIAGLLESQTRTRLFAASVTDLTRSIHVDVLEALQDAIGRVAAAGIDPEERQAICDNLKAGAESCARLDQAIALLLEERWRQWARNSSDQQEVMLELDRIANDLAGTLMELEYHSTHDPLTGLYNRRHFDEALDEEMGRAERHQREFAVLLVDLDDFKDINDTYGHPSGDGVLKLVSDIMRRVIRKGDIVCRIGGDEFAIVLVETGTAGAIAVAEKLRTELRQTPFAGRNGRTFHVTASIGVVSYPEDAKSVADLMAGVDLGLYRAKEIGKDAVSTLASIRERLELNRAKRDYAETLRASLREGRVVPYYQTIIDCRTMAPFAFETLARIIEPDGKVLSAGMFIDTVEKYGLGRELDRAIISQGLAAAKLRLEQATEPFHLFINLSAQEIEGRGMLGYAEQFCGELGIPPSVIVFEILERDAIGDMGHMRQFLTELKKKGFLFALDDFGSGYNSFHYLRELSFDFVKIDGDFVKNIVQSAVDQTLVRNLIRLCQELGILTIAEFIENDEIFQAVRSMGVDYAQGFHLGRPLQLMP